MGIFTQNTFQCADEVFNSGRTLFITQDNKDTGAVLRPFNPDRDADLDVVFRKALQRNAKHHVQRAARGTATLVHSGSGDPRPVMLAPVTPELLALRNKKQEREKMLVEEFSHLAVAEVREALTLRAKLAGPSDIESEDIQTPLVAPTTQPECLVEDVPMGNFNQSFPQRAKDVFELGKTLYITHGVDDSGAVLRPYMPETDSTLSVITRGKLRRESKLHVHNAAKGASFVIQSGVGDPEPVVLAPATPELMALRNKKRDRKQLLVEQYPELDLAEIRRAVSELRAKAVETLDAQSQNLSHGLGASVQESTELPAEVRTPVEALTTQPECLVRDIPMREVTQNLSRCVDEVISGATLFFTRGVKDAGAIFRPYDPETDLNLEVVSRRTLQAKSKRYFTDAAESTSFIIQAGSGEPRPVVLAPVSREIAALREKRQARERLLVERFRHLTFEEILKKLND